MNRQNKSRKFKIKIVALTLILEIVFSQVFVLTSAASEIFPENLNEPGESEKEEEFVNFDDSDDFSEIGFYVAIDYYAEKLRILNPNSLLARYGYQDYMEIYDNNSLIGGIATGIGKSDLAKNISVAHDGEYMYAVKAFSDETLDRYSRNGKNQKKIIALRKEKWYPIYGGGIDLSKIIPARASKNSKKQYYIAIRRADDVFNTETGFESRVTVLIKPRNNEKNINKFIEYDATNEKIALSKEFADGDSLNIIYRYDYFDDISGTLTKNGSDFNANIDVSGKFFPLGGTVYISTMPVLKDGEYGPEVVYARAKEIKFRIPKVPALPSIKTDIENSRLVSIKKDVLEWSLTGTDSPGSWQAYTKSETALPFSDVLSMFGLGEKNIDKDGNYIIYFRVKAVANKSPASLPKKILIPAELC